MPKTPKKSPLNLCHQDGNPEQMSSKSHCCKLLKGLQKLHKNDVLCDYTLQADGVVMRVHKVIMAAMSDYFYVMLTGSMKESREGTVDLKGITANSLKAIVDFAYTGNLSLTNDNIEEILSASTHLQVTDAIELCCKYLETTVSIENCVDVLNLAEIYTLRSTYKSVRQFILDHYESVAETDLYHKLNSKQISSLLEENSLCVVSEYNLFRLVFKWINYNYDDRKQYIVDLMQNVRLALLSGEELVEKVSQVMLMTTDPDCLRLLTEAKDYHIIVGKQPLLQSTRTQVRCNHKSLILVHAENLESFCFQTRRHGFLRDASVPLYNPCVATIDDFLYACGGKYDSNENSEIATARCFRYDPRFDSWHEIAAMTEARKDFAIISFGKMLYAIGGQDENMVMCTVECYNITTNEWEAKSSVHHSVYGHAGTLWKDNIFISGGQRFTGSSKNLMCYNVTSDTWTEKSSMVHSRMNHIMATSKSDKLLVLGGNVEDSYGFPVPVVSIEQYCPLTNQWSLCKETLNIREAGVCTMNNVVYIVGGINGEHYFSDLIQAYDPAKDEMSIIERFPTRIYGRACCILTLPRNFY